MPPRFHALVVADVVSDVLIYAQGHIDQKAATALTALITVWVPAARDVLLDLSEVDGMDRDGAVVLAELVVSVHDVRFRYPSAVAATALGRLVGGVEPADDAPVRMGAQTLSVAS